MIALDLRTAIDAWATRGPEDTTRSCLATGCTEDAVTDDGLCPDCDARFNAAGEHETACGCGECSWHATTLRAIGVCS